MILTRRSAGLLLTGGLVSACATRGPEPIVSINLADTSLPEDPETRIETAFDDARRMTVPVRLGRRGPFQFVVDTGANRTVVSTETAKRCGLEADGVTPVHGIVGVQPAPMVRVPRLQVGAVQSTGLRLPMLPRVALGADGLLGVDVLRGRKIRLDFRGNRFEIAPSGTGASVNVFGDGASRIPHRGRGIVVPAQYRSGQLVIFDADVDGAPVRAFLDSGAQITCGNLALWAALTRSTPDLASRAVATRLISATGQTTPAFLAPLPRLRLGGMALNNMRIALAPLHIFDLWDLDDRPALLVGVDVLRQFDEVSLDFLRREITFVGGHRRPD